MKIDNPKEFKKLIDTLSQDDLIILKKIIAKFNKENVTPPTIRELRVLIEKEKRKITFQPKKITIKKPGVANNKSLNFQTFSKYQKDIFNNTVDKDFRGWILPTGQILTQYFDGKRQDHGELARLFFKGLEMFDKSAYSKMMELYNQYRGNKYISRDIQESFAVEVLGWIQVSECGKKRVITCGERWQDKFIDPFIRYYDFDLEISDRAKCEYEKFLDLYNNIYEIMSLALKQKYNYIEEYVKTM